MFAFRHVVRLIYHNPAGVTLAGFVVSVGVKIFRGAAGMSAAKCLCFNMLLKVW